VTGTAATTMTMGIIIMTSAIASAAASSGFGHDDGRGHLPSGA